MTECEDEYKLGSKCSGKEKAKAAHFHACWLFWPPGPCLLLSPFCVRCLLPPGSGQKWAWALVWALKSFGYQPSVALYLQPSVKGPPAAARRSTSLPWLRGAGARSGDGLAEPLSPCWLAAHRTTHSGVREYKAVHFHNSSLGLLILPRYVFVHFNICL